MPRARFLFVIVFVAMLMATSLSARVYISIDSPEFRKIRIAISDFAVGQSSDAAKSGAWFSESISEQLRLTGYFGILDKKTYLENASAGQISFANWVAIGADYLLGGEIAERWGTLKIKIRLFDTINGRVLLEKNYDGTKNEMPAMMRKIAADVFQALTGERGPFDSKIAFVSVTGKKWKIFTVNFDGSDLKAVHEDNSIIISPRWSPSGRFLSFTSYRDGTPDIFVMNIDSGYLSKISARAGINLAGEWGKDGEGFLLTLSKNNGERICYMKKDGALIRCLTEDDAINISPSWSPDNKKIIFVSNRFNSPQLFMMDADGSRVQRLFSGNGYSANPSWSPRGDLIALENKIGQNLQVCVINTAGEDYRQLTTKNGDDYRSPSWSPCGRYIAFYVRDKGIFIINADGSNLRQVVSGNCRGVAWSPFLR